MDLRTYLHARGESQRAFGRRAGVPQKTVNRIAAGAACSNPTALAIIRATVDRPTPGGGTVSLEDLVARVA